MDAHIDTSVTITFVFENGRGIREIDIFHDINYNVKNYYDIYKFIICRVEYNDSGVSQVYFTGM